MPHTRFIFIAFLMCFSTILSAKHILSGSMTYECLGNNEYEFTMTIYRDCFGGGAPFDSNAAISIYKNEDEYLFTESVPVTVLEVVEPIDCNGSPVEYCSEKAVYKFTTVLENGIGPYNVVYQRCCWSDIVKNLLNPGEHGITVLSTVSELALDLCNSQPIIDMPLSFSACPGEEMTIPILPFDADGDSLTYEICMPLEGGGLVGAPALPGDASACNGISPNPACPPPYTTLAFADGFDLGNPFETTDGIEIDPINGTISFTPTTQGIFIYALCVTEFRDGQILGRSSYNIETTSGISLSINHNEADVNFWEMAQSFTDETLIFTSNTPNKNAVITLFDISGKNILSKKITNLNNITFETNNLNPGIYFATLNSEKFSKTFKVIIVR